MIDFQGLLTVLHSAERHPDIRMETWQCGTSNCMIGAFCTYNPDDPLYLSRFSFGMHPTMDGLPSEQSIAKRFGITTKEAGYLFIHHPLSYKCRNGKPPKSAIHLTKEQALSRLRKFIYYKLHKQEMTLEVARKVPGRSSTVLAANA